MNPKIPSQDTTTSMLFPSSGGAEFELRADQIEALEKEFPDKNVRYVLEDMRQKLVDGKYAYSLAGMKRAITRWNKRARPDPNHKRHITTPWEQSHWAARIGPEPEPVEGTYLPEDAVQSLLEGLKATLVYEQTEAAKPVKGWRECKHEGAGPGWADRSWWCPGCNTWRDQFMMTTDQLIEIARRR